MSRIRVLHCIGSLNRGGAQRQLELLIAHLDPDRFDTGILFFEGDVYGDGNGSEGRFGTASPELLRVERGRKWNLLPIYRGVARRIEQFGPDVVHTWLPEIMTIPAAAASRRRGVPIVSSQRRRVSNRRDAWKYLTNLLATTIVSNYDPEHDPKRFRALFRRKSGIVVRNGLDCDGISALPAASLPDLRRPELQCVYAGRLAAHKRIDLAIEAIARLARDGRDVGLLICGDGASEERARLGRLVEEHGLESRVRFLGFRRDWLSLLKGADALVLPSVSEGMSNVLLEAAAAGTAIVCARIDENLELFEHRRSAWMVEPNDSESLVSGLDELATDPGLRESLARGAGEVARSFAVDRMVEQYERLYRRLLEPS